MATKLIKCQETEPGNEQFLFWCPGCKALHVFITAWGPKRAEQYRRLYGDMPTWQFDGNLDKPTFSPSLLMHGDGKGYPRCHLFLKDGILDFLTDCTHQLAGHKVPLAPMPEGE